MLIFMSIFEYVLYNALERCSYFSSAGIGRTGTFIALDALYRQGMKEGKINIVEYVNTMREDRMNMIQNAVIFPMYFWLSIHIGKYDTCYCFILKK